MNDTRRCNRCKEHKPVADFYRKTTRGRQTQCKACWKVTNSASERRRTRRRIDDPLLRAQLDYIAKLEAIDDAKTDAAVARVIEATDDVRPAWRSQ